MRTFKVLYSIRLKCLEPYKYNHFQEIDITLIHKAGNVAELFGEITQLANEQNWRIESIEEISLETRKHNL